MNKTQKRLTELANELQDLAAKYEEHGNMVTAAPDPQYAENFKHWLHKEGYLYTRGYSLPKVLEDVKIAMKNQSDCIKQYQVENAQLKAGLNPNDLPQAFTQQFVAATPIPSGLDIDDMVMIEDGDENDETDF
jgi:hypothetical protein